MEGEEYDFEFKPQYEINFEASNQNKIALNTLSNISDMSKEMQGVNDSSLDYLADELFQENSNSNNPSSNKKKKQPIFNIEKNGSLVLDSIEGGQIMGDFSEYSGLADFIDKTLTKSNKNMKQAINGKFEKIDEKENSSISFLDLGEEFQKCKNLNLVFQKLNKAFSRKVNKECQNIADHLLEIKETLSMLYLFYRRTYSLWY